MTVTREDVIWCYRLLLEREPESDQVVSNHMQCQDRRKLLDVFLQSSEFCKRAGRTTAQGFTALPLDVPSITVQSEGSASEMDALFTRTRTAWESLGLIRPHHSVLTQDSYRPDRLADHTDEFWTSGEEEAAALERVLRRHGFDPSMFHTCVEYGCGVGRVTIGLARRFPRVVAYDISAPHLEHAKQRAIAMRQENIAFRQIAGADEISVACDFFYSCMVLQHNPPPLIRLLLDRALNRLKPGGVAVFQVPTYTVGYEFRMQDYLRQPVVAEFELHCLPQAEVFNLIQLAGCRVIEVREDGAMGDRDVHLSNTFIVSKSLDPAK